jgi:hypothetical protein
VSSSVEFNALPTPFSFGPSKERIRLRDEIISQIVSYRGRIQYLAGILKKSRNKEDLS